MADAAKVKHDKQQARRKLRNTLKRKGDPLGLLKQGKVFVGAELADGSRKVILGDRLLTAEVLGANKFGRIGKLNRQIDTGTAEQKTEAAKAKRRMNESKYQKQIIIPREYK